MAPSHRLNAVWLLAAVLSPAAAQTGRTYPYRGKFYRLEAQVDPGRLLAKPPESWRINTAQGVRVLVSETPAGPFTPLPGPHTPLSSVALDGSLFVEGDVPWLVYVHDWTQVIDSFIEAVPLKADLTASAGEPIYLFKASDALWHREQKEASREPRVYPASGPLVQRARNGDLLIYWSSPRQGNPVNNVARSMTGRMRGPWQQLRGGKP